MRNYLDHNASTPLRNSARLALIDALDAPLGNPSSTHRFGVLARATLDSARDRIASALGLDSEGLVFTSGGTESNNLAILGAARASGRRGIATTRIEHPSVSRVCERLASDGFIVRHLPLDRFGRVDLAAAHECIDETVGVLAVQAANQETGVLQPTAELHRIAESRGVHFHCDAAQLVGRETFAIAAHSITLASHKLGGPVGIAALWVRPRARLEPLLHGGPQERGLRPGTPAPALAASFAAALADAVAALENERENYRTLRSRLTSGLVDLAIDHLLLTPFEHALANTVCVSFPGVDRLALAIQLDLASIAVGLGSACSSGASEVSPVLTALGIEPGVASSAIRVSFGWNSTLRDVERLLETLPRALALAKIGSLRSL